MRALIARGCAGREPPTVGLAGTARVGDESGFVLIIAVLMLLVVTLLVGAIATAAVDVNNNSTQTVARDRALAAAQAGLQAGLFRLNVTGGSTGATGTLGNGATYTYAVSSLSASSSPCAGLWVQSTGPAVQQTCITSSGTVDGDSVRVQDRVVGYTPASPTFPVNGIFAVNGFAAGQNFVDQGDIRSNGPISLGGGTTTVNGNLEYLSGNAPTGSYTCTSPCNPIVESSALPVPTGAATSATAYANAAASNNDAALSWGKNSYSAATQTVTAGSGTGGTVTIPSGTYYFCNIDLDNSTTLQASVTNNQPVIIYIDSPYDTASTCAAGTGNVTAGNNFVVTNPTGSQATSRCTSTVSPAVRPAARTTSPKTTKPTATCNSTHLTQASPLPTTSRSRATSSSV
jgi:Tfp pilus assembly protein PilX